MNITPFTEFLLHRVTLAFPQQPETIVRGKLTAHYFETINNIIVVTEKHFWAYAKYEDGRQAIEPL